MRVGLTLILLIILAGRFIPGPQTWGFNHLAYLPGWFTWLWVVAAVTLWVPAVQHRLASLLAGPLPRFLFHGKKGIVVLAGLWGLALVLLRERSFFMGDGYLVGESVEQGMRFRAFDCLDYLAHFQFYQWTQRQGWEISSFLIYQVGSMLAGLAAVWILWWLVRRLPWEPWRKVALLFLLFSMGPVVFYFGYVESYSYLFLFITAFLVSGMLTLERRGSLWVAAAFFGLALCFHLTAVFSAPALLYLALRAPIRPAWKRWLQAVVPPLGLFCLAIALHVAEGYNTYWFRTEFLENENAQRPWIPWGTARGFSTLYHWKDLLNLVLITAPVCLVVVLTHLRGIRGRLKDTRTGFLLVQILTIILLSLVIDRKLGGARDWDLLAAHAGGLVLLATLFLPSRPSPGGEPEDSSGARSAIPAGLPHPSVGLVLGVACLVTFPWVLLLHLESRSISRFVDVATDFPKFARAYSYEDVGKYYRNAGEMDRAEEMYERCVELYPGRARVRFQLGTIYYMTDKFDLAKEQFTVVSEKTPDNYKALDMLGKVALKREANDEALDWFAQLVEAQPTKAAGWEMLGYAATLAEQPEDVVRGYRQAMELDSSLEYHHAVGVALFRLGRYEEAAGAFQAAIARGAFEIQTRIGLAWALVEAGETRLAEGVPIPTAWLDQVDSQLRRIEEENPEYPRLVDLRRRCGALRSAVGP